VHQRHNDRQSPNTNDLCCLSAITLTRISNAEWQVWMTADEREGNLKEPLATDATLSAVSDAVSVVPTVGQCVWKLWVAATDHNAAERSLEEDLLSGIASVIPWRASNLEVASELSNLPSNKKHIQNSPRGRPPSRVNNMLKVRKEMSVELGSSNMRAHETWARICAKCCRRLYGVWSLGLVWHKLPPTKV
jgi:hypothetical protein